MGPSRRELGGQGCPWSHWRWGSDRESYPDLAIREYSREVGLNGRW